MGWWFAETLARDPALLISWIVWVIGSIVLHELAHGWAAIRLGDNTPIETGHMTWNPLVHMGGMSLIVFALVGIAWGAMPVNPNRFRGRHADALVAAAGPAMNLSLAAICILAGGLWEAYASGVGSPLFENFGTFFFAGAFLNIILAAFNLLPVPPLDGSRILASFHNGYARLASDPSKAAVFTIALLAALWFGSGYIAGPAAAVANGGIDLVVTLLT